MTDEPSKLGSGTELGPVKDDPREDRLPAWTWAVFLLICGAWVFWFWLMPDRLGRSPALWGDRGTVGDWFGSLTALFSGLAFWGMVVTLFLQKRELRQNTKALLASKAELANQVDALKAQADWIRKSAVLSSVPTMMRSALLHIESLEGESSSKIYERTGTAGLAYKIEQLIAERMSDQDLLKAMSAKTDGNDYSHRIANLKGHMIAQVARIRALRWYLRLRKDLDRYYQEVVRLDPEDPYSEAEE